MNIVTWHRCHEYIWGFPHHSIPIDIQLYLCVLFLFSRWVQGTNKGNYSWFQSVINKNTNTVDFRLLVPIVKKENPNWPIKCKLCPNITSMANLIGQFGSSFFLFFFFLRWDNWLYWLSGVQSLVYPLPKYESVLLCLGGEWTDSSVVYCCDNMLFESVKGASLTGHVQTFALKA